MKKTIHKYKYILLAIVVVTSVGSVLALSGVKPALKSGCSNGDVSIELIKNSVHAALPPENKDQAVLVIKGSVCEIVKVYNDGDELRQRVINKYGTTKGVVGPSYLNSKDIKFKISQVVKGEYSSKLIVITIDGDYDDNLNVGDSGTFFIEKYDGTKYRMLGRTFISDN